MPQLRRQEYPKPVIPIAPMIDVVFLMLIYFMATSSLERQEADIAFQLPGLVEQSEALELPEEQIIEIRADGQVIVNDYTYDRPGAPAYHELAGMLHRFRQSTEANHTKAIVTLVPDDGVPHQVIVRVMDAINRAGIAGVNFALTEE